MTTNPNRGFDLRVNLVGTVRWAGLRLLPLIAGLGMIGAAGCRQNIDVPPTEVKAVEAYGVRLDETASPQRVVYVLLRSLRDDVEASQAKDRPRQKKAFETTFSLAAFSEIERRLVKAMGLEDKGGLADMRGQRLHEVINHWAPIVAHYIRGFDTDLNTAVERMKVFQQPQGTTAHVLYEVCHDPSQSDPAHRQPALLDVELAKEKSASGSQEFWRVAVVSYRGPKVNLDSVPATRPATPVTRPAQP